MGPHRTRLALGALAVALVLPSAAAASPSPHVAAVAVALRSGGFYAGSARLADAAAVLAARPDRLGDRTLRIHARGWAVRELQLALAWQGFPSGAIDGRFGPRLGLALRRFQQARRLRADGRAGRSTVSALRVAPPRPSMPLAWPLLAPLGDGFGPRGDRFHAGIDLPAPALTPVVAAAPGRVAWAGPRAGGWGNLVTIGHGRGVRTMYAHLSKTDVRVGDWVAAGTVIGRVGSTGDATGPHLHFEVRVRGGAVDPLRALVALPAGT